MWVILAQKDDYDEALEGFRKKIKADWTPEEIRRDRKALSLIRFISMMIFCKRCSRKRLLQNSG